MSTKPAAAANKASNQHTCINKEDSFVSTEKPSSSVSDLSRPPEPASKLSSTLILLDNNKKGSNKSDTEPPQISEQPTKKKKRPTPPSPVKISMDELRLALKSYLSTVDPAKVKLPDVYRMLKKEHGIQANKALKATIKAMVVEMLSSDSDDLHNSMTAAKSLSPLTNKETNCCCAAESTTAAGATKQPSKSKQPAQSTPSNECISLLDEDDQDTVTNALKSSPVPTKPHSRKAATAQNKMNENKDPTNISSAVDATKQSSMAKHPVQSIKSSENVSVLGENGQGSITNKLQSVPMPMKPVARKPHSRKAATTQNKNENEEPANMTSAVGATKQASKPKHPVQPTTSNECVSVLGENGQNPATHELQSAPEPIKPVARKPRGRKAPTTQNKNENKEPANGPDKEKVPSARGRPKSKSSACSMCKNCPCSRRAQNEETFDFADLAQSDAAVEKALIRRLQKLEKIIDRWQSEEAALQRKLKNHRRDMWKKRERLVQMSKEEAVPKSFFLPDAKELDDALDEASKERKALPGLVVQKAQSAVFSSAKAVQPTLTQMLGSEEDGDKENDTVVGNNHDSTDSAETKIRIQEEPEPGRLSDFEDDPDDLVERPQRLEETGIDAPRGSFWAALQLDSTTSLFDSLFVEPSETENAALNDLVDLFDSNSADDGNCDRITLVMLSEADRSLAKGFIDTVKQDPSDLLALQTCWNDFEENVCFCVHQSDPELILGVVAELDAAELQLSKAITTVSSMIQTRKRALDLFKGLLQTILHSKWNWDDEESLCDVDVGLERDDVSF